MENKVMPQLCHHDACTACSACYNSCSKNAITMCEDAFGELFPKIDESRCIKCGLCESVCPELNQSKLSRYSKPKIYCCWLKDSDKRKKSTSGGAAYAISQAIIEKGGHVWGAAYTEEMCVRYIEANDLEQLTIIQKSKYVQSYVGDAFRKIRDELIHGELVLFTGTGCHVKGLRSFLKKDYPNLLTLDLVCHGVPGQGVFHKYIKWIENKYGDKVIEYVPRPKRNSDGQELGYYSLARFSNRPNVKLQRVDNSYFVGFQHNLFLRTNCFNCQANGEERYSDFTVADFWGLGKVSPFKPYQQRTRGISMLALNSDKAHAFFAEFKDLIEYEERTYKEASFTNTQYYKSAKPSPRRLMFRNDYNKLSWEELASKYMLLTKKEMILYAIKRFTPPFVTTC